MWELEFMNSMFVYESDNIDVAYYTSQTLELELEASITSVFPLFTITFTLLITFSIVCCIMADWVRSNPMLGQLGVLSAGLAIVSSLGLMSYCGVPFINVVASMPFLILGIGVDDMFIMIVAWRKTPSKFTVEERMGHAYSEAALSITITSITDFLAFCIGAISFFPAVQIFCLYTGVAVLFDYLYQITFFGACMALFGRREAANRHCCSCMKVLPKKEFPSTTYRLFCAGGWSDKTLPDDEASEHVFKGIRLKNLANDDSYATTFYDLDDEYFKVYGPIVSFTIDEEVDYSSKIVQTKLYDVIEELKVNDYFHSSNSTVQFWLTEFLVFMEQNNITYSNKDQFIQILRSMFLVRPTVFDTDIQFNDDNTSIVASRFLISSSDSSTANRERNIMVESRRIADKSDIQMFAYHPAFVFYEQYIAILSNTLQNIGIAAGAMFLVSLILIPHPLCSLYVTLAIASISLGVIGYMTLWHVKLDAVAMINIIICIGFSVDFSAHITYAFVIAPHHSRNKRSVHALYLLGWPILEGALSTILRPCRSPEKEEVGEMHTIDPISGVTETKHGHQNPLTDAKMEIWSKEVCSSNRSLRRISSETMHTTTCEQ
uniref:Patched domain-containing protein 3-like n=1 Tax=Saccoglossus kowalevskii TaxID=10224 RepID=A0ABM0M3A7_SACKO|nr:PREDICTED: patched domain-containing protein 3-like [Saccoglossus kowalevskii]